MDFTLPYGLYLNHPTPKKGVWRGRVWGLGGENPICNNDNIIPAGFPKLIKTSSTNHKRRINLKPISSE